MMAHSLSSIMADLPIHQHLLWVIVWIIAGYIIMNCIDNFFGGS